MIIAGMRNLELADINTRLAGIGDSISESRSEVIATTKASLVILEQELGYANDFVASMGSLYSGIGYQSQDFGLGVMAAHWFQPFNRHLVLRGLSIDVLV
jgi:hypothetical protein